MERVTRTLGLVVWAVVTLGVSVLFLSLGYWLSDVVYDAGLWPVGMVMRVFLLFGVIGLLFKMAFMVFAIATSPFVKAD